VEGPGGPGRRLILHGRHPVLEALRGGRRPLDEVLLEAEADGLRHRDIWGLARQAGVRCSRAPRSTLTALAGSPHHQGVVARLAAEGYGTLEELLAVPRQRGEASLFLALDQVQDPGNVGSLIRTAEALGAHGLIVLRHQAAGLTAHAVKAAAGALEHLAVARVANLARTLEVLKGEGCWVVGAMAAGQGTVPPWQVDLRGPLALVLGSEGHGLRPLVARTCDALTHIPLAGRVACLNVAAAGAALLYEIRRQRTGGRGTPGEKAVDTGGVAE
jgi:23S rRNA (guanosine2251-2'-O)-methyltransferase